MVPEARAPRRISIRQPWIEESDVLSLFPTMVWKLRLRAAVRDPIRRSPPPACASQ